MKNHNVLIPDVVPTQYAFILIVKLKYVSVNEFISLVKQVTVSLRHHNVRHDNSHHSFLL